MSLIARLFADVDERASEIVHLKFVKSENLWDDFEASKEYVQMHGTPKYVFYKITGKNFLVFL